MLKVYIDESGHDGRGWMFLAGYIGSEEQWQNFVPKWKAALGPQRKFLHMSDLRGWNKDSRRILLKKLGAIPEACGLEGCMSGVRYQDYEDLVAGTPEEKLLRGYIACLFPLVIQILRGTPREKQVELIFEEQHQYEPYANLALPIIATLPGAAEPWKHTSDGRTRLAKWSYVPKGSTLRGDPADYLAYALREAWTDKRSKKAQWCRPILSAGNGEGYGAILQRDKIRAIIEDAQNAAIWLTTFQRLNLAKQSTASG